MLAAIPYETFPTIELGPLSLRTFGLMVGIGVLLGAMVAARYIESRAGVAREETYRMATRLVVAGVIGARLTFVVTHWEIVDSPIDIIAVWEGGLQFAGGFIAAVVFGLPFFRRMDRRTRWVAADGYAYGLALGVGIGRIGCYAVGEHFGRATDFFLATRYEGGDVREELLGDVPLTAGTTFHNTALYEFLFLIVLFGVLGLIARRKPLTGTLVGVFCGYYGVLRFLTDSVRVNDERVLSMTGAQWMCIALVIASAWILTKVRRSFSPRHDDELPAVVGAMGPTTAGDSGEGDDEDETTEATDATDAGQDAAGSGTARARPDTAL